MARSWSSERPLSPDTTSPALPLAGLRYPWPPLLLVVLTLLALLAAYSARPLVQIDLGDYYDAAYLENFHAREVDASGSSRVWDWPADSNSFTVPGGLEGDWMATFRAHPDLPGRPSSGVAVNVNDQDVSIPRSSSHEFIAFLPAELTAAAELTLLLHGTPTGAPDPQVGTFAEVELAPARTYRWTRDESRVLLPGLGRGPWQLDLALVTAHPHAQPVDASVLINGALLAHLPDMPEMRRVSLLVPEHMTSGGDMEIALQANTYTDPRPLGIFLSHLAVAPLDSSGAGSWLPPWGVMLSSLVLALALYANLALLTTSQRQQAVSRAAQHWRLWLAALAALAVLAGVAWALAVARYPTSFMLPGLAGLAVWSLVLLLALRPLLRWAFGSQTAVSGGPISFVNALLLIFFVSYWIKAAGMLYPYFIGIDVHWHMERVRWILNGALPTLYGTESPLNESTMPVAEWGENKPVIPYSPYFHMSATVLALLPWPLEFSANMTHALLDSSKILLIALLACGAGLSRRAALLAALLYAVLPINYLLLSWGNMPTTSGLFWAFSLTTFAVIAWSKLGRPGHFVALTTLLLGSLLVYTVAGVFTGVFLFCFTLALWVAAKRSRQSAGVLGGLRPLWLATLAALALALLIYYGQYIPPIINQTIPYFAEAFTEGHEDTGRVTDTWSEYLLRHERLAGSSYRLAIPLLLTFVYLVWAWAGRFWQPAEGNTRQITGPLLLWAAVAGWVGVMLLFFPVAYRVSMVDKHFIAAIPLMMIASAAILDRLWRYGWPVWGATLLFYLYLGASAISLWLTRIVGVQQIYE